MTPVGTCQSGVHNTPHFSWSAPPGDLPARARASVLALRAQAGRISVTVSIDLLADHLAALLTDFPSCVPSTSASGSASLPTVTVPGVRAGVPRRRQACLPPVGPPLAE
jgi:hypothetical protein